MPSNNRLKKTDTSFEKSEIFLNLGKIHALSKCFRMFWTLYFQLSEDGRTTSVHLLRSNSSLDDGQLAMPLLLIMIALITMRNSFIFMQKQRECSRDAGQRRWMVWSCRQRYAPEHRLRCQYWRNGDPNGNRSKPCSQRTARSVGHRQFPAIELAVTISIDIELTSLMTHDWRWWRQRRRCWWAI